MSIPSSGVSFISLNCAKMAQIKRPNQLGFRRRLERCVAAQVGTLSSMVGPCLAHIFYYMCRPPKPSNYAKNAKIQSVQKFAEHPVLLGHDLRGRPTRPKVKVNFFWVTNILFISTQKFGVGSDGIDQYIYHSLARFLFGVGSDGIDLLLPDQIFFRIGSLLFK